MIFPDISPPPPLHMNPANKEKQSNIINLNIHLIYVPYN